MPNELKSNPEDFGFTEEQITQAFQKWAYFVGFEGATCGQCSLKVNVLSGGSGWFCTSGHYNCQLHSGHGPRPHATPDLGPTAETIRKGIKAAHE